MDWSMILRIAALIISFVACLISFYNLGYSLGMARERKSKLLMNKILLDELGFIQYDINRLQEFLMRSFLKDRNNKERNEQQ